MSAYLSVVLSLAVLAGCSSYDASALERRYGHRGHAVDANAEDRDGGGASEDGDGGGPWSAAPQPQPECGDGTVSLAEKCDIGIAEGLPGACPTACPPLVDCVARELSGSNCQAECVVLAPLCTDGDGCCPADCTSAQDDDCSERCGDGIVQPSESETCEPRSAADPCLTASDCDDGDACTEDVLVGSEANCNTTCSHVAITRLVAGDGCCPEGADANRDGDCAPACGNGVQEPGEECDGGEDCDEGCMLLPSQSLQQTCEAGLEPTANACDHCTCTDCAGVRLDCVASGDPTRDMHCAAIIQCANDNDCMDKSCYCGDFWCASAGPCREVIDAAAAADPSGASVWDQYADPNTAIGRAAAVGDCTTTHCSAVCP